MTNLEMIQALIERTDQVLLEQGAFDPVPLSEKTATMAMLYQAAALERIASSFELVVEAIAATAASGMPLDCTGEMLLKLLLKEESTTGV